MKYPSYALERFMHPRGSMFPRVFSYLECIDTAMYFRKGTVYKCVRGASRADRVLFDAGFNMFEFQIQDLIKDKYLKEIPL